MELLGYKSYPRTRRGGDAAEDGMSDTSVPGDLRSECEEINQEGGSRVNQPQPAGIATRHPSQRPRDGKGLAIADDGAAGFRNSGCIGRLPRRGFRLEGV